MIMARLQRQRNRREVRNTMDVIEKKREALQDANLTLIKDPRWYYYAGIDPRRRKEMADAGMAKEDHRAIANLSPEFIHREYPRFGFYSTPYIDDTMLD
jgi:hypothetical protein